MLGNLPFDEAVVEPRILEVLLSNPAFVNSVISLDFVDNVQDSGDCLFSSSFSQLPHGLVVDSLLSAVLSWTACSDR